MEFPEIGENCTFSSCNRLDFLPFKCDACEEYFCISHYKYENHKCINVHKKDNYIPICPICNEIIYVPKVHPIDMIVNRHIESTCKSDLYPMKMSNPENICSFG
ncbi:unnamed protein product [Gordionus sp. m RMFG-2023]